MRLTVVPESSTLAGWAAQLDIDLGGDVDRQMPGTVAAGDGIGAMADVDTDDLARTLLLRGEASAEVLVSAAQTSSGRIGALLTSLGEDGLVRETAGSYRLTDAGRAAAEVRLEADRATWGRVNAGPALAGFTALDGRTRAMASAWQMRERDGARLLNDHTDPGYDAVVLDDLVALQGEVADWLGPLSAGLPRLARYAARLDAAVASAKDGDLPYVASRRVDSYLAVWRELHEDLSRLAAAEHHEPDANQG